MVVAGNRAEKSEDKHSLYPRRFRVYLFALAKSLLHEVTHVFITFLGAGRFNTPPNMNYPTGSMASNSQLERGEAGRNLESLVFGGRIYIFRNPEEDEDQVRPCLPVYRKVEHMSLQSLGWLMLSSKNDRLLPDLSGDN